MEASQNKKKRRQQSTSDSDNETTTKKKSPSKRPAPPDPHIQASDDLHSLTTITNTSDALSFLKSKFDPRSHFNNLPAIIFQHQVYSIVSNRTQVDRDIEKLRDLNEIRAFKYDNEEIALCYANDLKLFISIHIHESKALVERFQEKILFDTKELSISRHDLKNKYNLTEDEVTCLIRSGLLTIKDAQSWWFAIPLIGNFRRDLVEARRSVVNVIRKKKFKEVGVDELYKRSSKKISQIGVIYLICDLIGREVIRRVDSPMGFVVGLVD
jgi:serine/threonine-protein kinase 19